MNSQSSLRAFFKDLRKKKIIEILAAFIGGGWLLVEVVERLLVGHYQFPEETIDLTVVSVIGALLATLVWRWFCGRDKRPGNIKFEVLLVPLILLGTRGRLTSSIVLKILGVPASPCSWLPSPSAWGSAGSSSSLSQWAAAAARSSSPEPCPNAPTEPPIPSPRLPINPSSSCPSRTSARNPSRTISATG